MSSEKAATVNFSLRVLARRGGESAPHKDGWGIAYYEDNDVRILRDTTCAAHSQWVEFAERQALLSTFVVSHIRRASDGNIAIKNTQPFGRELGGRMHVFAHNGHLPDVRNESRFRIDSFQPIGDTDSEYAFCALLERLRPLWSHAPILPELSSRFEVVAAFATELGQIGLANFLYCDGSVLFAHGHRRKQDDGSYRAPGLHVLHRHCTEQDPFSESGVSIESHDQNIVLVASVPLTDEAWQPLDEGEVIAISVGRVEKQAAR